MGLVTAGKKDTVNLGLTNTILQSRHERIPTLGQVPPLGHQRDFAMNTQSRTLPTDFQPSLHEQMRDLLDEATRVASRATGDWFRFHSDTSRGSKQNTASTDKLKLMATQWLGHVLVVYEQYLAQWTTVAVPELSKTCHDVLMEVLCEEMALAHVMLLHLDELYPSMDTSFEIIPISRSTLRPIEAVWNKAVGPTLAKLYPLKQVMGNRVPVAQECWAGSARVRRIWGVANEYSLQTPVWSYMNWQDDDAYNMLNPSWTTRVMDTVMMLGTHVAHGVGIGEPPRNFKGAFTQLVQDMTFQDGLEDHPKTVYTVCFVYDTKMHPNLDRPQHHQEFWRAAYQSYVGHRLDRTFSKMVEVEQSKIEQAPEHDHVNKPLFDQAKLIADVEKMRQAHISALPKPVQYDHWRKA